MASNSETIPTQSEVAIENVKVEGEKDAVLRRLYQTCAISQEKLLSPIFTCRHGHLYNKSTIMKVLPLNTALPKHAEHIKDMNDVKELKLTPNPEYDVTTTEKSGLSKVPRFICPLTGLEMSGKFKFVCLWNCGCVISEQALDDLTTSICPNCQTGFVSDDVVFINENKSGIALMKRMWNRRKLKKSLKRLQRGPKPLVENKGKPDFLHCRFRLFKK